MSSFSECIARSLIEAGIQVLTFIPSYGASSVFNDYCLVKKEESAVSFHPEVAFTIAHGTSLLGKRAAVLLKAHGLLKAGSSILDSLYAGVNGGLVIFVFDDKEGRQSDSIVDITPVLSAMGLPYRVLDSSDQDTYSQILDSFAQSERHRLPYVLVVEAGEMEKEVSEEVLPSSEESTNLTNSYQRDITQHVLCPLFTKYQNQALQFRMGKGIEPPVKPTIPEIPQALPQKWHSVINQYSLLFSVFQQIRSEVVTGDVGVSSFFAFPPYHCIDITTCMGGSIPLAIGAFLAGPKKVWALTGDYAFISTGHLGLLEALQRRIPVKVLIFNNGKAETTGGQVISGGILDTVLAGYKPYIREIKNPQDREEVASILQEASLANEMRIVVADFTS